MIYQVVLAARKNLQGGLISTEVVATDKQNAIDTALEEYPDLFISRVFAEDEYKQFEEFGENFNADDGKAHKL